jgi:hypothetical protein
MAVERKWLAVGPVTLTANGTQFGVVTVADTSGFKVKGSAVLTSASPAAYLQVQIQRVNSITQMVVGPSGSTPSPSNFVDVSAYTVASGAAISFSEQDKNRIKADDIDQAVYESDPTVAIRTIPVDPYGNLYGPDYPMPVAFDGTISIGQVEIKGSPSGDLLNVNADGSLDVINIADLINVAFDDIAITNTVIAGVTVPSIIYYKVGGPTGTIVATLTLSYDGSANLTNVQRT